MIMCICDYGEVRSVAMRNVLRRRGYCSFILDGGLEDGNIRDIINMKPTHIIWMGTGNHPSQGFIGNDTWGNPKNKKLIKICEKKADELGFTSRK